MVKAVDFAVRNSAGAMSRGGVAGDGGSSFVQVGSGEAVSLNLAPAHVVGYERQGANLIVRLVDGREIVLSGFYDSAPGQANRLFLSSEGQIAEVFLTDSGTGPLYASYGPSEGWGKFSALDDLRFDRGDTLVVAQGTGDDHVGMAAFVPGLLGGLGPAALLPAALIPLLVGGGGDGPGGNTTPPRATPTVDDPDTTHTVTTNTPDPALIVTGTGEPGDTVVVTVGDKTQTTVITPGGTWGVSIPETEMPVDGTHEAVVVVTPPTGQGDPVDLDGPTFVIDLTPPAVEITEGTESVGHIENAEDHVDGVTIGGIGEPGATLVVTVNEIIHQTVIDTDGKWSVTFTPAELPGGEYSTGVTVVATDPLGNTTTITDTVVIDTIPHPVTIDSVTDDNTVNAAEAGAGFAITGTSAAGAVITVTVASQTITTTTETSGSWTVTYPAGALPPGEYEATITASTVDTAGNASSTTHVMVVDTVTSVSMNAPVAGDDVVNAVEAAAGVTLTGTTQAGNSVSVTWNTVTHAATVAADGSWTVTFTEADIPAGEYASTVTVSSTDAAGNTATATHDVTVDTVPHPLTIDQVTGDGIVNGTEASAGFAITGTSTAGAVISVTVAGETRTTTTTSEGTWSIGFAPGELAAGEYDATVTATTVDAAGNPSSATQTFVVDTVTSVTLNGPVAGDDVVNAAEAAGGIELTGTAQAGNSVSVTWNGVTKAATVAAGGAWTVTYATADIPAGEYASTVTVTSTDAAGNIATATRDVAVDTVPHPLTIDPVTADGMVNGAEAAAGFQITGESTPGATITVTIGGETRTATVGAGGTWAITYGPGQLTPGEYEATISASTVDAAGNPSSTTRVMTVDTTTFVNLDTPVAGNNIVNATEAADGVALSGTAQPGATVSVSWNGVTVATTATAAGAWMVTYPASAFASGEYDATVSVTATDAAGNTATTSHPVRIDTVTSVAIDPAQAGGDNIVSGAERNSGLVLTGQAEAGATVAVTFEGVTRTVTANGAGTWSASWAAGEIPQGTYASTVTVTSTDIAGNTATASHALDIDTEVTNFARTGLSTGDDDILNAVEATQGLTVTGTVEPGSTVLVRFGSGTSHAATVSADGTWTVTIPTAEIPAGENDVTLTATATDHVGNTASLTETVRVDTIVEPFSRTGGEIGGDGVLNAVEVMAGLPLNGMAEPGSTVVVTLSNGAQKTVVSSATGTWAVAFDAGDLPRGELDVTATITATDIAGNVATMSEIFAVDTVAPGSPEVLSFSRDAAGLRGIGTEATDDIYSFARIDQAGNQSTIAVARTDDATFNETNFRFASTVPDGSYLVVNTADAAGNQSSTLLIVDNTNAPTVDLSRGGLTNFDFTAIDLTFAPDARLTITEAQLRDLTGPDNRLMVKGGEDDTVTMTGAVATGQSEVIDGQRYAIYTLGSGDATLLLDDDIQTVV